MFQLYMSSSVFLLNIQCQMFPYNYGSDFYNLKTLEICMH